MKDILERFQCVAAQAGGRVAIERGGVGISYGDLAADAAELAAELTSVGVVPGTVMAVITDDRVHSIVALLAAMQSGACVMPLTSRVPVSRIEFALRDTGCRFVLTNPSVAPRWTTPQRRARHSWLLRSGGEMTLLVSAGEAQGRSNGAVPRAGMAPADAPFYIYYTSGSTGQPKGIVGQRQGVSHFIDWEITTFALDAATRGSQLTEPTFDAFFRDAFVPLCTGGVLCIPSEPTELGDGRALLRWLEEQRVSLVHCVPTVWRLLFVSGMRTGSLPSLRQVFLSGEVLHGADVQKWTAVHADRVQLVNLYGPSETTMTKFFHRVRSADAHRVTVPIGRPMDGAKAIVLDAAARPCGPGEVGEIYIRTPHRALGYLNRPELTRDVFVANPFSADPADIVYRTGDYGRKGEDGSFEFRGRKDGQVKIRGVRVEVAEVENALAQCPGLDGVVVTAEEVGELGLGLVAYYLASESLTVDALHQHARSLLSDVQVPSRFVPVTSFPRTTTGKIDRAALQQTTERWAKAEAFVEPVGAGEQVVAALFAKVLRRDVVSVTANFFALGGHSLSATMLAAELEATFGVGITLRQIFDAPNVRAIASLLRGAQPVSVRPFEALAPRSHYPLSSSQKRIFTLQQFDLASTAYNMPAAYRVAGTVTPGQLGDAARKVIALHEALRLRFVAGEQLVQIVDAAAAFEVECCEAPTLDIGEQMRQFVRPFDLATEPLVRMRWVRCGDESVLLIDRHHIVTDGVSNALLVADLARALGGRPLRAPAHRYVEYAVWQQSCLADGAFAEHRKYWQEQFASPPPVLELPTDYVRPKTMTFQGADCAFELGSELTEKISAFCRAREVTPFMVLFAAYSVLLARYSGQEDIVIGVTVAGRDLAEVQDIVGLFINILPLRVRPSGEREFETFLEEVKRCCLNGFSHQRYPFEELVNDLDLTRDVSRNPLFDTMFVVQNTEQRKLNHDGLTLEPVGGGSRMTKFDLTFMFWENPGDITFRIEYRTGLFARGTVDRMGNHLRRLLLGIVEAPRTALDDLELIDPAERRVLVETYNATAAAFELQPLHRLFERQAARTPAAVAVICGRESLKYAELDARSQRVARWLADRLGGLAKPVVAVAVRPSSEMVVLALGVLKSGGAYVPMDLEWPAERAAYVLENSGAALVLTRAADAALAPQGVGTTLEEILRGVEDVAAPAAVKVTLDDVAYIIYTSGSTGRPKGVVIEHGAAANTILDINARFGVNAGDRILGVSAFTFDLSVYDIWGALHSGAALVVPTEAEHRDPAEWLRLIRAERVTIWNSVPALMKLLVDAAGGPAGDLAGTLRVAMMSGDWIPVPLPDQIRAMFSGVTVISMGGATEASIWSIIYPVGVIDPAWRSIPYGYPLKNQSYYVLDRKLRVCPTTVPGELYIGGLGVARSYCRAPELTSKSFIAHPELGRLYRTGDMGRHVAAGYIVFMGRKDSQVKVNGYRIELEEIEAAALKFNGVDEAVAAVQSHGDEPQLALFYTSKIEVPSETMRVFVSRLIPRYMVPRHLCRLPSIPLSANGKVDRRALPLQHDVPAVEVSAVAHEPTDPVEQLFLRVWRDVLGNPALTVEDDFFMAGGDSIKAIQISSLLGRQNYRVRVPDILEHSSVRQLVAVSGQPKRAEAPVAATGSVLCSPVQRWFLEHRFAALHHWNLSVFLWRADGLASGLLQSALNAVVRRHELLRARLGEGCLEIMDTAAGAVVVQEFSLPGDVPAADAVRPITDRLQAGFNLATGPLLQCALVHAADGDHLLLIAHHLVVDGLSWRILIADLGVAYELARQGRPVELPEAPLRFAQWTAQLQRSAGELRVRAELPYWREIFAQGHPLWPGQPRGTGSNARSLSRTIDAAKSQRFLDAMRRAFRGEMNDCLLSAVSIALGETFGGAPRVVNLEGHGRLALADIDVSETIGWFTNMFPLVLDYRPGESVTEHIRTLKERLRTVPNHGVGYGILRYLGDLPDTERPRPVIEPEISFNYLGEFDRELTQGGFAVSPLSGGRRVAEENHLWVALNIVAIMRRRELVFNLVCDTARVSEETGAALLQQLEGAIDRLTAACAALDGPQFVPSDFAVPDLSRDEIDDLVASVGAADSTSRLEHVFALSPMQKGLLFHLMYHPSDAAYVVQCRVDFRGELDLHSFGLVFEQLLARHEMLRARVVQGSRRALLVTLRGEATGFEWDDLPAADLVSKVEAYLARDRRRPFAIGSDQPLMRAAVLAGPAKTWSVVFSFHHLVVDGWCIGIVLKDFVALYAALSGAGVARRLQPSPPYREYVRWLMERDERLSLEYWRRYLGGLAAPTAVFDALAAGRVGELQLRTRAESLAAAVTAALDGACKTHQVTLNSLMQLLWALLLGGRSGTEDVVYGVVVSGRNAKVAGMESMVGSFISTIPLRVRLDSGRTGWELAKQVQREFNESNEHSYVGPAEIQKAGGQAARLLDHVYHFQNHPKQDRVASLAQASELGWNIDRFVTYERNGYDFNLLIFPGKRLLLELTYNAGRIDAAIIDELSADFAGLAAHFAMQPSATVGDLRAWLQERKAARRTAARERLKRDSRVSRVSLSTRKTLTTRDQ